VGHLPFGTLVAAVTERPARAFGLPGGTLAVGAPADVVAFDPDEEWRVEPAQFASRGRNTPLAGLTLRGRVRLTLVNGAIVYSAETDL
jgi:dihydroorotase